jgi:hypothetical protein
MNSLKWVVVLKAPSCATPVFIFYLFFIFGQLVSCEALTMMFIGE